MKRAWIRWVIGLTIFIAVLSTPVVVWKLKQVEVLNVAILDKTVPDTTFRQHKGFVWLLNQFKYVKRAKTTYSENKDYFGYFPEADNKIRELDVAKGYDLLYITDTYGVYKDGNYGGLQLADVDQIKSAIFKGTSLLAEFNTFGSPTDPAAKKALLNLLGLHWSGWIGRYFPDLSDRGVLSERAISNYEKQTGTKWSFKGPGFLFINEDDRVSILEEGKDTGKQGNVFSLTEEGQSFIGSSIQMQYNGWFDIVEAEGNKGVLANYHLDLTESGENKLKALGIPATFPAVIKHETGTYNSYYFAGDYSNNNEVPSFYQAAWLDRIFSFLAFDSGNNQQSFYWKAYQPLMKRILAEVADRKSHPIPKKEVYQEDGTFLVSRTNQMDLQVYKNGQWQKHFVKGVNMGMAVPGKWFTEFPTEEETYLHWFKMIGEMNSNTIRVYTLMDPAFYRALLAYNIQHEDSPLWLLQEIWPEENPNNHNFLDDEYNQLYHNEIELDIDAIHGNASIPERKGRAYGRYDSNVSSYVLGYLVGRELEPDDVLKTDELNKGFSYKGEYLSGKDATATESWLAWSCDFVVAYEQKSYGWQHPVAIVSWPTLDSIIHKSEWNTHGTISAPYDDKAEVTIQHIVRESNLKAGVFGAYHIYPNYPDFMNNETAYNTYYDEEGRLRYGGYLQEFLQTHTGYPALVAEFGLATGMGTAHKSPDGYDHGGLTEETQGKGIVRMMKAIQREGYAGGLIFEWMDEWAKKTWTTEPFMIPYERHVLWHNSVDPEQNYGILAMEAAQSSPSFEITGSELIQKVEMRADESFLHIDITANQPFDWSKDEILIGLDTIDKNRGEMIYRSDLAVRSLTGMEFLVDIKNQTDAKLLVASSYNRSNNKYSTQLSNEGRFEEIRMHINSKGVGEDGTIYNEEYEDGSLLRYGEFIGAENHWNVSSNVMHIRLPWSRLNVTDPSSHMVLDDTSKQINPVKDSLKTRKTDGIRLSAVWLNSSNEVVELFPGGKSFVESPAFLWKVWDTPVYKERLKKSYPYIQEYFKSLP
jgi:hypothetical protein